MDTLAPCPRCRRHIRTTETSCPHCQSSDLQQSRSPGAALALGGIAVIAGLSLAACGNEQPTADPATGATTAQPAGTGTGAIAATATATGSAATAPSSTTDTPTATPTATATAVATTTATAAPGSTQALVPTPTRTVAPPVTTTPIQTRPPAAAYGPPPQDPRKRKPGDPL